MDKLVLSNKVAVDLQAGASLRALQVVAPDRAAMVGTWEQLTEGNLKEVQIQNGEGLTVGEYTDIVLVSETSVVQPDGSILTTYSLREKTAEERRLDALEMGQDVQDGAIEDMAAATSAIADQIGGM